MKTKLPVILSILFLGITLLYSQPPAKSLLTESFLDFENCKSVLTLHPMASDFTTGKEGVVLISTNLDNNYHTSYQEQDGIVKIRAILPETHAGMTVYFRSIDPDLDDKSSYEGDTERGDNRDIQTINGITAPFSGELDQTMVTAILNGTGYAVAETNLTITNRFAGDNYQVEASLDEDFSNSIKTIELIAWKRLYVEVFRMYKKGGTLGQTYIESENDNFDDILFLDNIDDFISLPIGTPLELFTQTQNNQSPIVVIFKSANVIDNSITINDPNGQFTFLVGSGIKIVGEEEVFDVNLDLIVNGFGNIPNGSDGGTFTEFKEVEYNNRFIPKFKIFTNLNEMVLILLKWRPVQFNPNEGGDTNNYLQLVGVKNVSIAGLKGTTVASHNLSILFHDKFINVEGITNIPQQAKAETVVHELGHQMGLSVGLFPVIHSVTGEYLNHEGTDQGVMARKRNFDDGKAEFYIDCIYYIRDLTDGI